MNYDLAAEDRKRIARNLYTRCGNTIRELADELKVDEATARRWVWEGEWDLVKTSLTISKEAQLRKLYETVEELTNKPKDEKSGPKDVDMLLKYSSIIKNLDTENSVYSMIETAEIFISWLYKRNRPLSQTFVRQFDIFIKERKAA